MSGRPSASKHSTFPRAKVLVLDSGDLQSLLPSTLVSQVDALLESHRVEDAVNLADQQRNSLLSVGVSEGHEIEELRYSYQRIGFQCLTETSFDNAGQHFSNGDLDPRVLISYFPELRGTLFTDDETLDMYSGVAEHMPMDASMDDLIRNYSPHLKPNTREAPVTVELRGILNMTSRDMLEAFLRRWRTKYGPAHLAAQKMNAVRMVVDTVLSKLYAITGKTAELNALLNEPNYIILPELEPTLIEHKRYASLCNLYRGCSQDGKLLEAWSKLVEREWADESVQDPLGNMVTLLHEKRDRALMERWGVWLAKRDPDRAFKLLTLLVTEKRKPEDDRAILEQVRETSPTVATQLLEHLVLQRRSTDVELHMQLSSTYVDQLLSCIADDTTSKLWRAKASSYASNPSDTSFISYFASTTPDSESKRVRLKTILFMQGSSLYDAKAVQERLSAHNKLLRFESAILHGKLGEHRIALTTLVHDLHDSTSAEIYCTLAGEVIPAKVAQSIGDRYDLQPWAALLLPPAMAKGKPAPAPMSRQGTADPDLKKSLIGTLLEVYMSGGPATAELTARFLNSQATNFDALDVLELIPPEWPLRVLSTFLTRSFRQGLHARHEAQIVKAISAGENLVTADKTWLLIREQGAMIEEPAEGDDDDFEGDEKAMPASFDEKVELKGELGHEDGQEVLDIPVPAAKDGLASSPSTDDTDSGLLT